MAFGKSVLVLCLGLLAVQAYTSIEASGPAAAVEEMFKQLQKVVQDAVNTALSTLNGFIKEIGSAAQEFEQALNATLVAACKPFIDQINNAVAVAAKAGFNVVDCVGNSTNDILDLPAQLLRNVTSCVTDQVNEANDVINNFINDINSTVDIVFGIGNDIKKCEKGSIITLPICLAGVTANITAQLAAIPLRVAQDIAKAKIYVATIIPDIAVCDVGAKAQLGIRAASIVADVTTCIADKTAGRGTTSSGTATTASGATDGTNTPASGASAGTTSGGSSTNETTTESSSSSATAKVNYVFQY